MARIVARRMGKRYGANTVVEALDLTIEEGEFVVIVGPSGCGKSTTLRMVAGLEGISSGELYFDDRLMNDVPPEKRNVGMVFQNYALYPHMTIFENLAFGLKARRTPKPEIQERVREVAELLELDGFLKRRPKELSGGQRQRVALGRAIVRRPAVFLMDEPLSNLDAGLRERMRVELRRLHQRLGITTLYVTHDQSEALTLADRLVVMEGGEVKQADEPQQVYALPADRFVAGFIGSPGMNLWTMPWKKEGDEVVLDGALRLPSSFLPRLLPLGDTVTIGIRPEHFSPVPERGSIPVSFRVEVVERLGSHLQVHGRLGDHPIVARLEGDETTHVGETTLYVAHEAVHLFHARSGKREEMPERELAVL